MLCTRDVLCSNYSGEILKRATMNGHFRFVFEENSAGKLHDHCFRKALCSKCFNSTPFTPAMTPSRRFQISLEVFSLASGEERPSERVVLVFAFPLLHPGGYLTKFNTGRLRPEVQHLILLYTILAEKIPLLYTFY